MNNKFKKSVFSMFLIFCYIVLHGQGRVVSLDYITGKFEEYIKAVPREEIFIHTDRDDYVAGEEMWFNVYVVDRQSSKTSFRSEIVYVELLNRYNNPVLQRRILVSGGSGPGYVVLPDSVSSGNYTLRAYTNWMRNFLPANCFMKDINIYNAFSGKAFKIKPLFQNIVPAEQSQRRRKPGINENIFSMETSGNQSGDLFVSLNTNEEFRSRYGNVFYIIIETNGNINHKNTIRITSDITEITITSSEMSSGLNHITLLDVSGEPVYEKYIYTPVNKSGLFTLNGQDEYNTREKITLNLSSGTVSGKVPDVADMSVSVIPMDIASGLGDIKSYMVFGTEFGIIPDSIRKRPVDEIPPDILNSFLLTLKSNWIDWYSILNEDIPSLRYSFEKGNHFLTGRLVNRRNLLGNPGEYIFMSTPSKSASFQYSFTDSTGSFVFAIPVTNDVNDLVLQPEKYLDDNTIRIESSFSDLVYPLANSANTERDIPSYMSDLAANYQVSKIYGISFTGDLIDHSIKLPERKRFYGKPDIELFMNDYIKLPVMQEVFFELLPGVTLRERKSGYELSVYDFVENRSYNKPPGIFIDGVLINDPATVANLDPELVEQIDVVREAYFVADYLFYGIVSIITRAGDLSNVELPDHAIRIPYRVSEPVYSFSDPDYSVPLTRSDRIPDFRNTLYWNTSLVKRTDNDMSFDFWASDLPGNYMVNIQGITSTGEKISLRKTIRIKREHLADTP